MIDDKNININPEDYWPDAEKMLDQHFKAKKYRRYLVLLLALLLSSSAIYYTFRAYHNREHAAASINAAVTSTPITTTESRGAAVFTAAPASTNSTTSQTITSQKSSAQPIEEANHPNTSASSTVEKYHSSQASKKQNMGVVIAHRHSSTSKNKNAGIILAKTSTLPKKNKAVHVKNLSLAPATSIKEAEEFTTPVVTEIQQEQNYRTAVDFAQPLNTGFTPDSITGAIQVGNTNLHSEKTKRRSALFCYAGLSAVDAHLTGNSTADYLSRRNKEESSVVLPHAGVSFSTGIGKWEYRAGIQFSMLGEKVNYSASSKGEYYSSKGSWQNNQYTVSDSDSTFIYGIIFITTHLVTVHDSTYTVVTDTLNGPHYNPSILRANGVNKSYYMEFPLEVAYTTFINRWGLGISAGVSPAMLVATNGYYLESDQSDVKKLSTKTSTRLFLNGAVNLELSYLINEKLRVMLRPTSRMNLTEIKDGSGTRHQYRSVGVNAAIVYTLH